MYLSNKNIKNKFKLIHPIIYNMYNLLSANEHISICINVSRINTDIDQRESNQI